MAIANSGEETIYKINKFLGLNENPDGDTTLKVGEMAEMRNFRITQDNHLQVRAGTHTVLNLNTIWKQTETPPYSITPETNGVWFGTVNGTNYCVVAYGGHIYAIKKSGSTFTATKVGTATVDTTTFFGFNNKVYMLNGHEYKSWDGNTSNQFTVVSGYVPTVKTATSPSGNGTTLEAVNRLNGKRKVMFSPDGTSTDYVLPEQSITSVDSVKINGTATSAYTTDLTNGKVTFTTAPTAGTNTVEIAYTKGTGSRSDVESMHYSEMYNGASDTRIFLYGDGSNKAIYSGIDSSTTLGSAEYFPDLYEIAVGEANTKLTAMVRHFNRLMAFKENSTYSISYGTITLEDSSTTAAFYCTPVNRQFGNDAMGQVKLLENNPLTIDGNSIYQWKPTSNYSNNISNNENNAKRISDRVVESVATFDMDKLMTFNLKHLHEYWFLQDGKALILNYTNDTWYIYQDLPFKYAFEEDAEVYGICPNGKAVQFTRSYRNDDGGDLLVNFDSATFEASTLGGEDGKFVFSYSDGKWYYGSAQVTLATYGLSIERGTVREDTSINVWRTTTSGTTTFNVTETNNIDCYAMTGAMDFNKDWVYKYSSNVYVALQPESSARIFVTVESNRRSDYPEKQVSYSLSTFLHVDFNHWSFGTNRKPQVKKLKLKVKKAAFYRLIFKSNSASSTATVIETDVRVRYAGYVK